jgi:pimeloyl-ACP methyl ester carboxylesterase
MSTFVLIHGAGSDSWYWHLVAPMLRERGYDVVAPDLPSDDDSAGFGEYAETVVRAIGGRRDLTLVAQSMAGFTAPMVCERATVDLLVMVAAMVPKPDESAGEWWSNTGQAQAQREQDLRDGRDPDTPFDLKTMFFHDVPEDVVAEAFRRGARAQSRTPFNERWPLRAWPAVPTRFLLCRHDRIFPRDFMRRVVKDRLGIVPDEMDGGHLPALARPRDLVERLVRYRTEFDRPRRRSQQEAGGIDTR